LSSLKKRGEKQKTMGHEEKTLGRTSLELCGANKGNFKRSIYRKNVTDVADVTADFGIRRKKGNSMEKKEGPRSKGGEARRGTLRPAIKSGAVSAADGCASIKKQ